HWMKVQWEEEIEHGLKFYKHLLDRGGEVELKELEAPKVSLKSAEDAFQQALEHERYITKRIHKLYDLAREEGDYPLQTLLHWFIDEQVEEEEITSRILEQVKMIGEDASTLLILDRELGEREDEGDE
ncbi:MAG: ferritin, partial [Balneolaceae bacterium]|nr:ferritin [Balneolaceae bacterium]